MFYYLNSVFVRESLLVIDSKSCLVKITCDGSFFGMSVRPQMMQSCESLTFQMEINIFPAGSNFTKRVFELTPNDLSLTGILFK